MTRQDEIRNAIDTIFPIPPSEKGRKYEQALMATGFEGGVKWADAHPKSPWISVNDDLPCNHEELLSKEKEGYTESVMAYTNIGVIFISMRKYNDGWKWETSHYFPRIIITHWFPIPELPKEQEIKI